MNKKIYPIISVIAHVLLIAIGIIHFDFSVKPKLEPGDKFIESYVTPQKQKATPVPEKALTLRPKAQINLTKNKPVIVPQKMIKPPKPQGEGAPVPALSGMLHDAVQMQLEYPDTAREMEREGQTKVGFILFLDGTISNLHIVKSSGTTSLDQAALAAVMRAVPFQKVQKFLHKSQDYELDVVFKLT